MAKKRLSSALLRQGISKKLSGISSTDSAFHPPILIAYKKWTEWTRISGRLASEWVDGLVQNRWMEWARIRSQMTT